MKRKFLSLLFCGALATSFAYAQEASDFGPNDKIIANFEDVNPMVTDSLWMDSLKTTPVTVQSANVSLAANPDEFINVTKKVAKYVRPAGGWRSIYIRLDKNIVLSQTPNFQIQIFPVAGNSPAKSSVSINLINDKNEIVGVGGYKDQIPQDEWTTVTAFLGRQKSSVKFNAIEIQVNNGDSTANADNTEYYIDQIGFKVPTGGVELPATVFYETFGGWIQDWHNGKVPGQHKYPKSDGTGFDGPGEYGTAEAFASVGGFTSGIPFTFRDLAADTVGTFIARCWGMPAKYEGASGGGRTQFRSFVPGTLETGDIDVNGFKDLVLSFGIGTQQWYPFGDGVLNARPKVEISVDGGAFYEIYSESAFLQATGEMRWPGWGDEFTNLQPVVEDQIFTLVEYPFTNIEGATLSAASKINLRMSYKSGSDFWIDDLWLAGKVDTTGVATAKAETVRVHYNATEKSIVSPNAQKVTVCDLNGRIVKEATNAEKVNVSSLAQGVYIVKVKVNNVTKVAKFVKK